MTTPRMMFLLCLAGPALASAERQPMGVKNSRSLEHYKERLDSAIKATSFRLTRTTTPQDHKRKVQTMMKLQSLRRGADQLTPESFSILKRLVLRGPKLVPRGKLD